MKHNDQSDSVAGWVEVDCTVSASSPRGSTSLKIFDIVLETEKDELVWKVHSESDWIMTCAM